MTTKELIFPRIFYEERPVGYGGNQEWFLQNMQRNAGCGSVCGANLAACYALNEPEMRSLYDGHIDPESHRFQQQEYLHLMEEMYSYMKPGPLGYPYLKRFARQFQKFAQNQGISLHPKVPAKFVSFADAFSFVQENIDQGHPIALLILFQRAHELRAVNWHWMTITGYESGEEGGQVPQIILSNYGKRQKVRGDILFEVHWRNYLRMVSFSAWRKPSFL
ncbi:hypothetical protein [Dehalobacterium formicoaceticum]|uniref:Peptidase C39-like domain-containing protein n=1 Tax=Dehalobacterium formicoaceticum TaxID=51515 RepID=A0ABT1XZV1_9FIRM|nr:hypothetical protein [Dehalobacterium formicoaceticum]MCR6544146.1 hypothetical protein [Dehalobacterium formicoaceticum]